MIEVEGGKIRVYERHDQGRTRWMRSIKGPGVKERLFSQPDGSSFRCREDARLLGEAIADSVRRGYTLSAAVGLHSKRGRWTRPNGAVQEDWKERLKLSLLRSAKRRAEAKGLAFAIGREHIPIPVICPALGIELQEPVAGDGFANRENSPSIDRIDSSLGYVPGNVVVISWRANSLKRDATPDELRRIASWASFMETISPPDESDELPARAKAVQGADNTDG